MKNFKTLLFLIKRDMSINKKNITIKFLSFYIFFISSIFLLIYYNKGYKDITINEIIFSMFKGYDFVTGPIRKLPILWIIINSFIIYVSGYHFYDEMKTSGKYLLLRVRNVKLIFLSKAIWSIIITALYYIFLLGICTIIGYCFKTSDSTFLAQQNIQMSTWELVIYVFSLYFFTSVSLNIIFIVLTLIIKPIYSFLISVSICVMSIFSDNIFLIGQHSLLLRHRPFNLSHNLTLCNSILFNAVITITISIVGCYMLSKKEIY